MSIECERVLKRRVFQESHAAIADCGIKVVARPIEDALVGLVDLLVLRDDAERRSIDGGEEIILREC